MAIKVSGTSVVSDARQLENITSIDEATKLVLEGTLDISGGDTLGTVTGSADLDLSSGNYFEVDANSDITYSFSNPEQLSKFTIRQTLSSSTIDFPYDLSKLVYSGDEYSFGSDTGISGLSTFSSDGTKYIVVRTSGTTDLEITVYTLPTPYLSTPSSSSTYTVSLSPPDFQENRYGTGPSVTISSDGTKVIFAVPYVDSDYAGRGHFASGTLSSAYDFSTLSLTGTFDASPYSFPVVDETGSNLYLFKYPNNEKVPLGTSWDVSTAGTPVAGTSPTPSDSYGEPLLPYFLCKDANADRVYFRGISFMDFSEPVITYEVTDGDWHNMSTTVGSALNTTARIRAITSVPSNQGVTYAVDELSSIKQYDASETAIPTVDFPGSVVWVGAEPPSAYTDGSVSEFNLITTDGGTSYFGTFFSDDSAAAIAGVNLVEFKTSGTYTPPSNLACVEIIATGGGGGGGNASTAADDSAAAAQGGGGGATVFLSFSAAEIAGSIAVSIGASGSATQNGGTTVITLGSGLSVSAFGGRGGASALNVTGRGVQDVSFNEGEGGSVPSGILGVRGGDGGRAIVSAEVGNDFALSGAGGGSYWGSGEVAKASISGATSGGGANAWGGGGAGAVSFFSERNGGSGRQGYVLIKEYLK